MKLLIKSIFCIFLGIGFSGCVGFFMMKSTLDLALPVIDEVQVIPDVSSIAFEWKRVKNKSVEGFAIFRQEADGAFECIEIIKDSAVTHYIDKGLKPESVYAYQFATIGADYTISRKSKTIRVKTSFIDPVEGLYAQSDEPRMVKLIWAPHRNPSVEKYIIEKKIQGEWKAIGSVPSRLLPEYIDRELSDGTKYEYRIVGVSFEGDYSKYSESVSATTKYPPKPIENLEASNDVPNLIVLKWKPLQTKDLSKYAIYASRQEKKGFEKIAEVENTRYEFHTEENGERWFFKVVAVDRDGIQGSLNLVPVSGNSLVPPAQPNIKSYQVQNGVGVIEWTATNTQRVNKIYIYRKSGLGDPIRFVLEDYVNQWEDKDMQKGVKYTYWVEFVDVNGIKSESSQHIDLEVQ
ncbi:hypothetical protein BBW65_01615 [Helicobacter enhydrae]|uniref:Fibronectin type-III domain-containing protein n=1 Tax=Helicobacter enhydrae TaxID=222136 RepID=A0A1B1U477_9HELI|nr:fibronectin type III domain-containing protein [Helicobacter enhydrae]ANV97584.1 hypothetical protein BBW65_01615 [Helicobacter enhydrae]